MTPDEAMRRIDALLSHVWMVRTFIKHSEESEEDEEAYEVVRDLYDSCLAVGPALAAGDAAEYLKIVRKKIGKLRGAAARFAELQPQLSAHTNFKMAVVSLQTALADIEHTLGNVAVAPG